MVTVPPCLEALGEAAFLECGRLTGIDLGETSVRALSAHCFRNCVALTAVVLPPNLDSIGQQAFHKCGALARLKFPATLRKIEDHALSHTGLTEADFRKCPKLAKIGNCVLCHCDALRNVRFGPGLASCGDYAFCNCPSLTTLDFRPCPNLRHLGTLAFYGCSGLRQVHFGSTAAVTPTTFTNCTALELISVPMDAPIPPELPTEVRVEAGNAAAAVGPQRTATERPKSRRAMGEVGGPLQLRLQRGERPLGRSSLGGRASRDDPGATRALPVVRTFIE
jgi:hypothetical protein